PEDRHLSGDAHQAGAKTGKMYYEARLILDGAIRWIRIQGNIYFNAQREPQRVLGTVLDITEQKRLEQQKDDFVSIASHELRTPITSLNVSLE
ncbi:PAS domain S-box protein, partial [Klebsiella pneumoniae]|nr:PAS domain S-box protein [Klebsiella pneumoniae]